MRPIALAAEGFGPFRDRIDVDFEDAEFFALVGPTGSGKSSVIDAMCFGLYGFVPRYGDQRLVSPAVTLGAQQAKVRFTFEAAGERYVATRVVRRTSPGRATTKECRLERLVDGGSVVLAGDPREADRMVQEVLGLSPEHFTRCVVLPQGEFSRFLHDKPSDRQEILVKLLGLEVYGVMASRARARAADAKTRADVLGAQLAELADATEEAEQAAAERVAAVRELGAEVVAAGPRVERARGDIADASQALADTEHLAEQLAAVRVPADVVVLGKRLASVAADLERCCRVEEQREAAACAAEQQCDQGPDIADLRATLTTRRELDDVVARLPDAELLADTAGQHADAADKQLARVDAELETARDAVHALERAHLAHTLVGTLVLGEPCPVCAVPVRRIPDSPVPAELSAARTSLARLEKERRRLEASVREAHTAATTAQAELARLTARDRQLREALTDDRDSAALATEVERVQEVQKAARELRRQAGDARRDVAKARDVLAELEREEARARTSYTQRRDALAVLHPPPPTADVAADWTALVAWADAQRAKVEARLGERGAALDRARAAADAIRAALRTRCLDAGVRVPAEATYESLTSLVVAERERAQGALERIRLDRDKARRLREDIETLTEDAGVADELGRLLSARGFEAWVLAEAQHELVAGASTTLEELSQGAYSLDVNDAGDYVVVDHREADATRPAKTLSGGETFQASLALALADHLGQFAIGGASKLESIFLDEGFGTLDDDSLEVVAATLDALSKGTRIVGVVTHVKELAARVPVRFEVRRSGRTAVVERVPA